MAAGVLLLRCSLMLPQGRCRQNHGRRDGNGESSYHPILPTLNRSWSCTLAPVSHSQFSLRKATSRERVASTMSEHAPGLGGLQHLTSTACRQGSMRSMNLATSSRVTSNTRGPAMSRRRGKLPPENNLAAPGSSDDAIEMGINTSRYPEFGSSVASLALSFY